MTHSFCVFVWHFIVKFVLGKWSYEKKTTIISRLHTNKHVNWKAKKEKCAFFHFIIIFHQLLQQYFLWASTSTLNADGSDIYNITNTYRDTLSIGKMFFFSFFLFCSAFIKSISNYKDQKENGIFDSTLNIWRQYQHACIEHWKRLNTKVPITHMVE